MRDEKTSVGLCVTKWGGVFKKPINTSENNLESKKIIL
jgi:hypothetical protein